MIIENERVPEKNTEGVTYYIIRHWWTPSLHYDASIIMTCLRHY